MEDSNTLLNVEDVFVSRPIWALFFLRRVPMWVQAEDCRKRTQQRISHPSERWVVHERVVRNQPQNATACLIDLNLRHSEKLDVIVLNTERTMYDTTGRGV